MKKKTAFRRIIALCLTVVLVLAMSVPVFAKVNENGTANITVSGVENKGTVMAYKVIDIDFNYSEPQGPKNPMYTWNAKVANWIGEPGNEAFQKYVGDGNAVTKEFENLRTDTDENETAFKAFLDALAAAIKSNKITGLDTTSQTLENSQGKVTLEAGMGAYLILVEGGVSIYSPGFAQVYPQYDKEKKEWNLAGNTIDVIVKAEEPTIDKEVEDPTVGIGDEVTYTLTIDVPQYPENALSKKFVFGDRLPQGLDFKDGTVEIKTKTGTVLTDCFEKVEHPDEAGATFEYKVKNYDDLKTKLGGETSIIVTYQATVNEKAINGAENLVNEAYINYNNDPYTNDGSEKQTDTEKLYTYNLKIVKVDATNKATKLSGAEFELRKEKKTNDAMFFIGENGSYRVAKEDEQGTTTLTTDNDGNIQIKGLDTGKYILTEIKAPDGYHLPGDADITITITDDADTSAVEGADGNLDRITAESDGGLIPDEEGFVTVDPGYSDTGVVTVQNSEYGFALPLTGGPGTVIFSVAGVAIMGIAVAVIVSARRKRA